MFVIVEYFIEMVKYEGCMLIFWLIGFLRVDYELSGGMFNGEFVYVYLMWGRGKVGFFVVWWYGGIVVGYDFVCLRFDNFVFGYFEYMKVEVSRRGKGVIGDND